MVQSKCKGSSKQQYGVTRSQRFATIGLHPRLDKEGTLSRLKSKLAPGYYNPKYDLCFPKNKQKKSRWKIEVECEEFSKNLGFGNADKLAEREFMTKHLGPGSHEINEALFHKAEVSPCQNQHLGKQRRFFTFDERTPGPGTYKKQPQERTKFGTCNRALRWKEIERAWSLAPNRYNIKWDNTIEATVEKRVSKRGPYDTFTGNRDEKNIFNHFSTGYSSSPDKFYTHVSSLTDLLKHPRNKYRGLFLHADRFLAKPVSRMLIDDISMCYKDPNYPSPAHYDVKTNAIKVVPEQVFAFGLTGLEARPHPQEWKISPGPGRYFIRKLKCGGGFKGATSVFKSKTGRTQYKAFSYNAY